MTGYFKYFPTVAHDLTNNGQKIKLTNILKRFRVKPSTLNGTNVYYEYQIQSHDRPETVAAKYYGNSGYYWIILMINKKLNPIWDWPLFYQDFDNYIIGKYGSVSAAQGTIHEYRQIISAEKVLASGERIAKRTVVVDLATYNTLAPDDRENINKYDWEEELNDAKRKIMILDKKYLGDLRDEVKTILTSRN